MVVDLTRGEFPQVPMRKVGHGKKYLGILLHGYGSDGFDMLGLTEAFDNILDDIVWLCPHAPMRLSFGGYAWFPLSDISQRELDIGAKTAFAPLNDFIKQALEHYEIAPENLILGGFSQGSMMTLYTGLRQEVAPKVLLGYSGALTAENDLEKEIKVRPPVLIVHGGSDDVVFPSYAHRAEEKLKELDVPVEKYVFENATHTIPMQGIEKTYEFLKKYV